MVRVFIVQGEPEDEDEFRIYRFAYRERDAGLDGRIRESIAAMAESFEPEPGSAESVLQKIRRECIEKNTMA